MKKLIALLLALVMVLGGIFWKKGTKEGAIASAL